MANQILRTRIVVYKLCKPHKRLDGATMERECADCRKLYE